MLGYSREKKVEDITAELKVVNNKNTQIKHQIYKLTDSNHDLNDLVYFLENEMRRFKPILQT